LETMCISSRILTQGKLMKTIKQEKKMIADE
jgi:hypothetical protein